MAIASDIWKEDITNREGKLSGKTWIFSSFNFGAKGIKKNLAN